MILFCPSECDPLPGVQAGVHGSRRDGKHLFEGFGGGSQQHSGEDGPGWSHKALPCGGCSLQ